MEMSALLEQLPASWKEKEGKEKRKKRKLQYNTDESNDPGTHFSKELTGKASNKKRVEFTDSDNDTSNNDHYYFGPPKLANHKRASIIHYSPEIVVEIIDRKGEVVPIRALLDTCTTGTLLLEQYVAPDTPKAYSGQCVVWSILGGTFRTKKKVITTFEFPTFEFPDLGTIKK
jgi:hypothetical protein